MEKRKNTRAVLSSFLLAARQKYRQNEWVVDSSPRVDTRGYLYDLPAYLGRQACLRASTDDTKER